MISEINRSVSATLYERVSSPFYGALAISWCLWNWKIIYVTFIVSESSLKQNKIEWILENCSNSEYLVVYPLISTFLVITVFPFVTNSAYWLHLKFIKWRRDKKNSIDMKTLLTTEQSIKIREEIIETEKRFDNLLSGKNQEIKELNIQLKSLRKAMEKPDEIQEVPLPAKKDSDTFLGGATTTGIANKIKENGNLQKTLNIIIQYIQNGWEQLSTNENVSPASLAFFEVNHLIKNDGGGMYSMTDFGNDVVKLILDDKL